MGKKIKMMVGWFILGLASIGILVPHVGFISGLNIFSDLNTMAHAVGMSVAVILILIGALLIAMTSMIKK